MECILIKSTISLIRLNTTIIITIIAILAVFIVIILIIAVIAILTTIIIIIIEFSSNLKLKFNYWSFSIKGNKFWWLITSPIQYSLTLIIILIIIIAIVNIAIAIIIIIRLNPTKNN